ncbi:MAG TPA: Rieske (2Fe-2S) protein [Ktedonobacteraceae bacterium]|nr:Rieske (2Fe-2S) protein [Ktedonobacteraceae bacterium]
MADEDQERFEDYLELEHYIEELQAGRPVHPPAELTPTQARIYRMVALFRSASPEDSQPRSEFAAELQARLEQEVQKPERAGRVRMPFSASDGKPEAPRQKRAAVSRRTLLTGSAAAAASLVVGTGIGVAVEKLAQPAAPAPPLPTPAGLLPEGEGHWVAVAKLADLGNKALRFTTDALVGYLIRSEGDQGEPTGIIAFSAACTHMGCIVQWQSSDRRFHCPCHGGIFSTYGKPDEGTYLDALPRLDTRVAQHDAGDFIEVRVPGSPEPK